MTKEKHVSRRSFLAASAATTLAVSMSNRVLGANDRVMLGIVGTGGRGQSLLKRLTRVPNCAFASVCDLRPERRGQAAEICAENNPQVKQYENFQEMLEKEKLDGCMVATEVGNHGKCVIPVLATGIPCFSEKPMDCTVEKVDAIVKAAREAKGFYQVGFQRRYAPAFLNGVGKIHEGAIGDVTFLQGCWHWTWGVGGWVGDVDMSGGEIVEQACHHMDVMNWVMKGQHPVSCAAMGHIAGEGRTLDSAHNSEDQSSVNFFFPNGAIFSYTHLFYLAEKFEEERLIVHGKNGGVDLREGMLYPRPGKGEPKQVAEKVPDWEYGTYEELAAFVDQIRNNKQPLSNQETGRVSTLMSLMAHKAMYQYDTKKYEPSLVKWEDLGTTTDL